MASAHGIYRGGVGVHLAMKAMGGGLGMEIDLTRVPSDGVVRNDILLFSESAGRFLVTVAPNLREDFERIFRGLPCACIGKVSGAEDLVIKGLDNKTITATSVKNLKAAWKAPLAGL